MLKILISITVTVLVALGLYLYMSASIDEQYLGGVVYGNGEYVVVGNSGGIWVSGDLNDWENVHSGGSDLNSVAYGNGVFVSVGDGGTIRYSDEGRSWNEVALDQNVNFTGVDHGGGQFVVVGTTREDMHFGNSLVDRAYAHVAAPPRTKVYSSIDGESWSELDEVDSGVSTSSPSVVFIDDTFYIMAPGISGGRLIYLREGRQVGSIGLHNSLHDMANGEGVYVGASGGIMVSEDAESWENVFTRTSLLDSVAYGNGVFVATGKSGAVYRSENGRGWEFIYSDIGYDIRSVEYVNDVFIAVGKDGAIFVSEDGSSWGSMGL